jgi:hypothetical protein
MSMMKKISSRGIGIDWKKAGFNFFLQATLGWKFLSEVRSKFFTQCRIWNFLTTIQFQEGRTIHGNKSFSHTW